MSSRIRLRSLSRVAWCALGFATLAPVSTALHARQAPAGPPSVLTPAVRGEVVDTLASHMARFYAVADTGRLIAEHLLRQRARGAYDAITNPVLFAEALSTDMRAINNDAHLSASLRAPGMMVMPMGVAVLPQMNFGAPPPSPPQMLDAARRTNFNIGRVEVIPGNIGYLEVKAFSPNLEAREAWVAALRLLEHTDAMIIDVRNHIGGSGDLSNFLISHFIGAAPVHNLDIRIRAADQYTPRWTLAEVPGPRRPDVPVYVLTSRGTVSAGEDFAFVMKNLGRGTLVGETTIGAGRNNPSFDIGHGFVASISVSTVQDPRTGAEWEGTGVAPDIAVPPRAALEVAHEHALRSLAARAEMPARKRELELTREYVAAANSSNRRTPAELDRFVGTYGGERTITVENGQLVFRRLADRLGQELRPLGDSEFALGPVARLRFEMGASGQMQMHLIPPMGEPLIFERTGPAPVIRSEYGEGQLWRATQR